MAVIESTTRPGTIGLALLAGTPVEVQNRFTASWCGGFEIVEAVPDPVCIHYRIRRTSDGTIIPDLFGETHVRPRR
jgi:hypothetical protein